MRRCTLATVTMCLLAAGVSADEPRNITLFIADGCGANTHAAYEMWRGGPAVYRRAEWREHRAATYGLRSGARPERGTDPLAQDERLLRARIARGERLGNEERRHRR